MRILFVSTNRSREIMPPMPLGIASLVPYLELKRHTFQILDLMFADKPLPALRQALADFEPEVVAFSIRNLENQLWLQPEYFLPEIKGLVAQVRRDSPAKVIVGGAALGVMPKEIFCYLEADAGIAGEAEEQIGPLLDGLAAGHLPAHLPGLLLRTSAGFTLKGPARVPDLNRLITPARACLRLEDYRRAGSAPNLVSKRGCHFNCIFCDTPISEGNQIRAKSPTRVADEVQSLQELGFEECFITDPVFNYPPGYAEAVAAEFVRRGFITKWSATLHPRYLSAEQLDRLKQAGLSLALLGSDHASADMLDTYDKQITPAELLRADELLRGLELPYFLSLLVGGPGETRDTLARAFDLVSALRPRLVTLRIGVRIYPGTPLHRRAVAEGRLKPDADLLKPVFYLAAGAENWIVDSVTEAADAHPNWIISGRPKRSREGSGR